jgi:hypothetical protein
MDMIFAGEDLVLAVRLSPLRPKGIVLYVIHPDGSSDTKTLMVSGDNSFGVNNACLATLLDNSLLISGSYSNSDIPNGTVYPRGYIMRLNPDYTASWSYYLKDIPGFNPLMVPNWGQNSIIPLNTNQFLFEYSISGYLAQNDSTVYGLLTGLINPNGVLASLQVTPTGFFSAGNRKWRRGFKQVLQRFTSP